MRQTERDRERQGEREREKGKKREGEENVCKVYVNTEREPLIRDKIMS